MEKHWKIMTGILLKKDLNKRSIEGIDGNSSKEEILKVLNKYGLSLKQVPVLAGEDESEVQGNPHNPSQSVESVSVEIWGSGKPMREFLWSEDMADACVFLMENRDFKDTVTPSAVEESPYGSG